jgi:hypothetical protein
MLLLVEYFGEGCSASLNFIAVIARLDRATQYSRTGFMTDAACQCQLYEAQRSTATALEYWIARSSRATTAGC